MVPQVDTIFFGGSRSEPTEIIPGLTVQFRTLTTREQIDVLESGSKFRDPDAKALVTQVHTLARAMTALNGSALILDSTEKEELKKSLGKDPTPVEEAVQFISEHLAPHIIAALDRSYMEFYMGQLTKFDELKKKSQEPSTGE